jgi:hypothetical protein
VEARGGSEARRAELGSGDPYICYYILRWLRGLLGGDWGGRWTWAAAQSKVQSSKVLFGFSGARGLFKIFRGGELFLRDLLL